MTLLMNHIAVAIYDTASSDELERETVRPRNNAAVGSAERTMLMHQRTLFYRAALASTRTISN